MGFQFQWNEKPEGKEMLSPVIAYNGCAFIAARFRKK